MLAELIADGGLLLPIVVFFRVSVTYEVGGRLGWFFLWLVTIDSAYPLVLFFVVAPLQRVPDPWACWI